MALKDSILHEVAPPHIDNARCIAFMLADLARSGLTPEDIDVYPTRPEGFQNVPAYVIKFPSPSMWTKRLDQAKNKYIGPTGHSSIWYPPSLTKQELVDAQVIYVVEGEKKAAKFYKQFKHPTIGIRGCYGFSTKRYSTDGTPTLLPELVEILRVSKTVKIIFDADIRTNIDVQTAAQRFAKLLDPFYIQPEVYITPEGKGADDWLVANPDATIAELELQQIKDYAITVRAMYAQTNCIMHIAKDGTTKGPKLMEANATRILEYRFTNQLYEDAYSGFFFKDKEVTNQDALNYEILCQIQNETHEQWPPRVIHAAVNDYLKTHQTNTLLDYLRTIEWDKTPRLDTWATDYIEARNPKRYIQEWGRLLISSIMLRLTQPGTQTDRLFGLIGRQGIGKTTFFRELSKVYGREYYYQLAHVPSGSNGDNITLIEGMRSAFVVDLDEGIFMQRASAEQVKSLITSTESAYRQLYAVSMKKVKRGNIFVTTCNKAETLVDTTGSRRFMLLKAEKISYLPEDIKLQLLAEALYKEREIRGAEWYVIDPAAKADDLESLSEYEKSLPVEELQNRDHVIADELNEWLLRFFDHTAGMATTKKGGSSFVTTGYLGHRLASSSIAHFSQRYLSLRLTDCLNNPHYPFKLQRYKPRVDLLNFKDDNMKMLYMDGVSNEQGMLTGFIVAKK